eukprot:NODE_3045_length_1041_cov_12.183807_g2903_i0.p1 GENE.NODE_3045_length_1041_cov_12.183807_g2903_i0~~NODE_3045_length_1041_cov_12.183807_g2903_i0.p1  ORF type:complete len:332 (+),score=65.97 NODE_3045_length_1041_cov_12.183807_g2903_i0:69-998(+)
MPQLWNEPLKKHIAVVSTAGSERFPQGRQSLETLLCRFHESGHCRKQSECLFIHRLERNPELFLRTLKHVFQVLIPARTLPLGSLAAQLQWSDGPHWSLPQLLHLLPLHFEAISERVHLKPRGTCATPPQILLKLLETHLTFPPFEMQVAALGTACYWPLVAGHQRRSLLKFLQSNSIFKPVNTGDEWTVSLHTPPTHSTQPTPQPQASAPTTQADPEPLALELAQLRQQWALVAAHLQCPVCASVLDQPVESACCHVRAGGVHGGGDGGALWVPVRGPLGEGPSGGNVCGMLVFILLVPGPGRGHSQH